VGYDRVFLWVSRFWAFALGVAFYTVILLAL
jgi:hypothetical protein